MTQQPDAMPLSEFYRLSLFINALGAVVPLGLASWLRGLDREVVEWSVAATFTIVAMFFLTRHAIPRFMTDGERSSTPLGSSSMERRMLRVTLLVPLVFMTVGGLVVIIDPADLSKVGWMAIACAVCVGKDLEGLERLRSRR